MTAPVESGPFVEPDAEPKPASEPTMPTVAADRPEPARALPRSLSARYEDLELLGEGGMGVVYRGYDPRLGRAVALKLIKGDDPGLFRRFIQEARAQARVEHPNVCRVYEAGQADGEPYIAMQLIEGEPLSRLRGALSLEQGVRLVSEVAWAVHEAHRWGLIHRDIKPQNILVERPEDGPPKPYVVDFGLAREVTDHGQTTTGTVLGTPAFMPPEQALGDLRAMDRRSDVYALGATLYDLVAGHPPFVSEHTWKLLMSVAYEDPPPLGQAARGVPADLETIVMKAIERDPGRRYASARALAEDLARFLDGEPILAKRASWGYVAWKKAKKHKLSTSLAAATVAAALSLGGVWAKGKRDAAEQARLAEVLGEDVKGMELFLRSAHGMPLHDVERERDVIRARLSRVEATMKAAGKVGEGPGHYAMGRGYLALGDPASAQRHLESARAAGQASPALDQASGQALGELYRRAMEETKRITNEAERAKRVSVITRELRDPALARLRAAVGAEIEAPAYAEGLIALYEGKPEEALAKAREAFAKMPWLYEAKRLEGDALYAMGSPFRHDGAFDWDKMMGYFKPAAEAYRAAADLARSDPEVHRAECDLWEKIGWAEDAKGAPSPAGFDTAALACDRAVAASHADTRARVQRALVLSARVRMLSDGDPSAALKAADIAVEAAEEALRSSPDDVMALYARARALFWRNNTLVVLDREIDMGPVFEAFAQVTRLDPQFTWAFSELGDAYVVSGEQAYARGLDARPSFERAVEEYERASSADPAFVLAAQKRVKAKGLLLQTEIERGAATDAKVDEMLSAVDALEQRMGAGQWLTAFWRARALRLKGLHEAASGRDPRASLHRAVEAISRFLAPRDNAWLLVEAAECWVAEAEHSRRRGLPARSLIDEARASMRDATKSSEAVSVDWRMLMSRIELLAAREDVREGRAPEAHFEAASAPLSPILSNEVARSEPRRLMAEIHARRAAWLVERGKDPRADLAIGRALAGESLARSPRRGPALAVTGLLALVEAAQTHEGARRAARARAREAFAEAFQNDASLALDYEEESKAARAP